ncbi:MAG: DUF2270 domain-containing protein [Chloroflexota bacterium]
MNDEFSERGKQGTESSWQFAGSGLGASEFSAAMVHFYRAEVTRSNTWRERLDATTNWAVISTGAALTFAFSGPSNTHMVIILVTLLVLLFLFIEARRYRYYELWTSRVRVMETNFIVDLLNPPYRPGTEWAQRITESLQNPRFPISLREALGRRYRRNYAFIFLILAGAWILKVLIHPLPAGDLDEFLINAQIGPISGWIVILTGVIFNAGLLIVGVATATMRETTTEVIPEAPGSSTVRNLWRRLRSLLWDVFEMDLPHLPWLPHLPESRNQMAFIVTDEAEAVSRVVMKELGQGVTRFRGEGMFTGEERSVLMSVFNARQVANLQHVIHNTDPEAFVVILGVRDVRGSSFRPLEA